MPRTNWGRDLNRQWNINALHALYRETGTWYHNLKKFPGAFIDKNGYLVFDTPEDYERCPQLRIGKETNIPNGISKIPGYVRVIQP